MNFPDQITPSMLRKLIAADPKLAEISQLIQTDRPFRLPKSHAQWSDLANIAAVAAMGPEHKDQASRLHDQLWAYWFTDRAPLYCISNELLRAFEQTDTDGLGRLVPADWVPPLPLFLLALPNSSVQAPDGANISYLLVMLTHPDMDSPIVAEHPRQISVACLDAHGNIWFNGSGIFVSIIIAGLLIFIDHYPELSIIIPGPLGDADRGLWPFGGIWL
jgi:hypothetical protein